MSASCFPLVVVANGYFLAFVQGPEHGILSLARVNWALHLVRWSGENDHENGQFEVACSDVPIGKLGLAEGMLEAPPTLVADKRTAGLPC